MTSSPSKLRLAFSLLLALLTVLVGIVFIGEIADIYYGSEPPAYTPETLRTHLVAPFVLLFIWIAAIIAAYVVFEVCPEDKKRASSKNSARTLALMRSRIPEHGSSDEFIAAREGLKAARRTKTLVWSAAAAICVAGAIYMLVYLLDASHYHPNALHDDAMNLVRHVISWTAASLVACFAAAGVEAYFVSRELNFAKTAMKTGDRSSLPVPHVAMPISKKTRLALLWTARACVLVISVAFIAAGATNGGADGVLVKAINICTECIGLG